MTPTWIARGVFAGLLAVTIALGAGAAPADKQAFIGRQAMYVAIEITETGTQEFGTVPKDSLTDGAHRYIRSAKFEIPLNMAMPDSCPPSTVMAAPAAILEPGRCVGWMSSPDTAALEEQLTTGKVVMAGNPMYSPVDFSIDDVIQFRYRDTSATRFATETTTSKGRGVAYAMRSGMLTCDLQKMTCDLNNLSGGYFDGTDLVTVSNVSDVPGFEAKRETVGASMSIPKIPQEVASQFVGLSITLPEPITKTFTGPTKAADGNSGARGVTVTVKLTLSSKPGSKAAAAGH
jgi:hypothetical protein